MHTRAWRACARAAVAITVGALALAAGGMQAVASPAGAASSSGSTVINLTNGEFNLIVPNAGVGRSTKLADSNVTAFHGFSTFKSVTIQSQGFDLEGTIHGRLRTYDYTSLWQVYNLPSSSGWSAWVFNFKHDTSQSVLKETFRDEQLIDVNIDIKFKVSAAALRGVSTLRIGFETLRLQLDGTTKDFTVVNGASGGAKDQNNNDVPVDFQPV